MHASLVLTLAVVGLQAAPAPAQNAHYFSNRAPLTPTALVELPVGAVRPEGWLRNQLAIQADGLTGHLDEFWPSLRDSKWKGGNGDSWERGPYYLDGLVPLAYTLGDQRLIEKVKGWMEPILASARPDGWFGPADNPDRWPRAVALKVLAQYYEATGDTRALEVIKGYCRYLKSHPPDWPDDEWRGRRAVENTVVVYWLYNRTGDKDLLEVARSIQEHSFNWTNHFLNFPFPGNIREIGVPDGHSTHGVNNAMAIKYPGLWWQQSHDDQYKRAVYAGLAALDAKHGNAVGGFNADEHFAGLRPTQGMELCIVVEEMFALEQLVRIFDDPALADRLELLAYNANPGTCTPDYWAHQYDQQANQVLVSVAKRDWTLNDDTSNLYGLEPNFGCCTANMHQGWPKFVTHLWMATTDNGLAAVAYGPSKVTAKVADGIEVTITERTDYPFDGTIKFTVDVPEPTMFPLRLRIPAWADDASVQPPGQAAMHPKPGTFVTINGKWKRGDVVELKLPMKLRVERRYRDAVTLYRGPLCFALRIGEKYTALRRHSEQYPAIDWQIEPTTTWNYGLWLDSANPEQYVQVETRFIRETPFGSNQPPVVLRARGRQLPEWKLEHCQAGETPLSPATSNEPITDLELIPYGSTRLRITEFPLLKPE